MCVQMFDNLSRLAEDVGSRILNATDRSSHLIDKLVQVESRIQKTVLTKVPQDENQLIHQKKQTMKFLKIRSAQHIPSALNKQTNCAQISGLYGECTLPPQFWKLEALTFDDCLIRYSNPGDLSPLSFCSSRLVSSRLQCKKSLCLWGVTKTRMFDKCSCPCVELCGELN